MQRKYLSLQGWPCCILSRKTSGGKKFKTERTSASLTSSLIGGRRSIGMSVNSSAALYLAVNIPLFPDLS